MEWNSSTRGFSDLAVDEGEVMEVIIAVPSDVIGTGVQQRAEGLKKVGERR